VTPGLPLALTPGLSLGPQACNPLSLGREPKVRVATKLALVTSQRHRLFSSSGVTIGTSSLTSLGGCPCAAQVMGTIGDLPSPFEMG
jgi:hypothetical protein